MRISSLIVLPLAAFFMQCGSNLDLTGRGAETKCLFLATDSMKIVYSCDQRNIVAVKISSKINKRDTIEHLLFKTEPGFSAKEFVLPVKRDSLEECYSGIELHLENSHFRETWYIDIRPGDLEAKKKITARYYGH